MAKHPHRGGAPRIWLIATTIALLASLLGLSPAGAQGPGGFCTLHPNADGSADLEWNVDGGLNRETSIRVDDRWLFTAAVGDTTATIDTWDEDGVYAIRQWKQSTRFDFACQVPAPITPPNAWCFHTPHADGTTTLEWNFDGGANRETNVRIGTDWAMTLAPVVTTATIATPAAGTTVTVRQWKQANRFDQTCLLATAAEADDAANDEEATDNGDAADVVDIGLPADLPPECDVLFLPRATDVAITNLDTLGFVEVFERFGADLSLFHTPEGFVFADWDFSNPVLTAVVDSWYQAMPFEPVEVAPPVDDVPIECFGPIPEEELAQQAEYVEALVAAFTEAGIAHDVVTDGPFTFVDFDFEDPEAAAIEFAIAEAIFGPFEQIPEEDLELQRAFNEALAAAFTEAGIPFELVILPDGWEFIDFDFENQEALDIEMAVAEAFFGPFDGGFDENLCFRPEFEPGFNPDFEPRELSQEELAEINRLNSALSEAFSAAGIGWQIVDDGPFPQIIWDFLDGSAYMLADEIYQDIVGLTLIDDGFIPEDVLEEIRVETEALAVAFDNAGVPYMVVSDEFGFTSIEYDFEDPQAQAIAEAVLEELYGPFEPIPDEVIALQEAEVAALSEAFDAAGIAYQIIDDPFGGRFVDFDFEDPGALAIYEEVQFELYYAPCDEIPGFIERTTTLEQLAAELEAAGVTTTLIVEGPFVSLTFDVNNPAAVGVVSRYL